MKIGLIDVDGHNYPNLPLMKISAWHKQKGDVVEWYEPFSGLSMKYSKVYMSKVFSFSPDYNFPIYADEIIKGGSGYCIDLINGNYIILGEFDNEETAKYELAEMGKGIASSECTLLFPFANNGRGSADVGVPTM